MKTLTSKIFVSGFLLPLVFSLFLTGCSNQEEGVENGKMNTDWHNVPISDEERDQLSLFSNKEDSSVASGILNDNGLSANRGLLNSVMSEASWGADRSSEAFRIAKSDNAGPGYCAKGVANILLDMGYPVTRGNAHDWDKSLPANGWTKVSCSPQNCPEGAVLQYESNVHLGKPGRSTGGQKYGHVEIVTGAADGSRKFCSDACRNGHGGTVPENFTGAWIYQGKV